MKKHTINHKNYEGRVLSSYTLGIIGCGAIGTAVVKIAHFFGMRVLINSYMKNAELTDSCEFVDLDELLLHFIEETKMDTNIQSDGYDGVVDTFLTDCGLEVSNEECHGILTLNF